MKVFLSLVNISVFYLCNVQHQSAHLRRGWNSYMATKQRKKINYLLNITEIIIKLQRLN